MTSGPTGVRGAGPAGASCTRLVLTATGATKGGIDHRGAAYGKVRTHGLTRTTEHGHRAPGCLGHRMIAATLTQEET